MSLVRTGVTLMVWGVLLAATPGGAALARTPTTDGSGTDLWWFPETGGSSNASWPGGADTASERTATDLAVEAANGAEIEQGGSIVFTSDRDGDSEVFAMNADTTGLRQLTHNTSLDEQPSWSPDGERIVYMHWDGNDWELFVMDADGANQRQLTHNTNQEWRPAWSPDGAQILFASNREGDWKDFVMNPDGGVHTPPTGYDTWRGRSPDGTRQVFADWGGGSGERDLEIFVSNVDGTDRRQLTHNTNREEQPSWSPDGERIVFTSDRDGDSEVFAMNADGTGLRQLTHNTHKESTGYSAWSARRLTGKSDLFDDVPSEQWETVYWAVNNGIASGVSDSRFDPNGTVTRAQAITFIYRAFPRFIHPGRSSTKGSDLFGDIPAGHWADEAVGWAVENGVASGTEGRFNPDQTLNRAHAVAFLYRAAARFAGPLSPSGLGSDTFSDIPPGLWADQAIGWAVANGVTRGVGDSTFDLHSKVTRWQMVTLLNRLITRLTTAQPDPHMCRPPGVLRGTAGFPLPAGRVRSTGTVRVAVLFVDFPDATATHTTHQEAERGIPGAEKYLEMASYGNLDLEFAVYHRWLRTEHNLSHYLDDNGVDPDRFQEEIARLADPEFDFSGYDIVMIVMPSTHLHGGAVGGSFQTDEGNIPNRVAINFVPREDAVPLKEVQQWSYIGAHELAHTFGLLDMYPSDSDRHRRSDPPSGTNWIQSQLGAMGMKAYFPAPAEDLRLAYERLRPDGSRSIDYYHGPAEAFEMLAWSRWQLGWLKEPQVRCVTEPRTTITLGPIAAPGDRTAMAAIPLSETEMIVIESRRKLGYDTYHRDIIGDSLCPGREREPCLLTGVPALLAEGVLVYTVDSALGDGDLPLKVVGDTGNGQVPDYPILTPGQSVTTRGYTVTVQSATQTTHTITITKTTP